MTIPREWFIYSLYYNAYAVECKERVTFKIKETGGSQDLLVRIESPLLVGINQCKCKKKIAGRYTIFPTY